MIFLIRFFNKKPIFAKVLLSPNAKLLQIMDFYLKILLIIITRLMVYWLS